MSSAPAVLRALGIPAAIADATGIVEVANAAWSDAGVLEDVTVPPGGTIRAPRVRELLRAPGTVELRDGSGASARTHAVRVAQLDGAVLITIEDLTELRRAQDQYQASHSRLRSIIAGAPIVLLGLDPDGTFTIVEGVGGSRLGATPELLLGRSIFEAYAHVPALLEAFRRALGGEDLVTRVEVGTMTFEVQFSSRLDPETSKVLHITGVATDITERTRIERMKNEFVSVVSHELRTPLTSIRGSLGLLEGGVVGALPDRAHQLVTIARNNADRLIRLINDMLDLDKLEAGRLEFQADPVASSDLLQGCVDAMQGMATTAGVTLAIDDGGIDVTGDRERLLQVLVNFVSNAIKFSPEGSVVTLAASRVGGRARFEVRDQGPGIPDEIQDRLFKKFQQLEPVSTRTAGGSGLGLAISKAIVDAHGGRIGVESRVGAGSSFFFDMALRGSADEIVPRARAAELRGRTVEIDVGKVRDPTRRPIGTQLDELIDLLANTTADDTPVLVDAHAQASVMRATLPPDAASAVGEHLGAAVRSLESLGLRASGDHGELAAALADLQAAAALTSDS